MLVGCKKRWLLKSKGDLFSLVYTFYLSNLGSEFSFLFKKSMETYPLQSIDLRSIIFLIFKALSGRFF